MRSTVFVLLSFFIILSGQAAGSDQGFVDTENEMVDILAHVPDNEPKTRGLTRSFRRVSGKKTRAIRVKIKDQYGQAQVQEIQEPVQPSGSTVRMKIEFDIDSAVIRSSAYPALRTLGKALGHPDVKKKRICIKGHTDSDGSDEHNLQLSYDRAWAVLSFLVHHTGVDVKNLHVMGYGESNPLVPNDSSYNKQKNRRVEVSTVCPYVNE